MGEEAKRERRSLRDVVLGDWTKRIQGPSDEPVQPHSPDKEEDLIVCT